MTERDKLQLSYELAFFPPRLNELWSRIRIGILTNREEVGQLLDTALLLHQALPDRGYGSQRALARLAQYQAHARAFGMVGFLRSIRRSLGRDNPVGSVVPGHLVRDIGLPPFDRTFVTAHAPPE
jgi:hypothetical protein